MAKPSDKKGTNRAVFIGVSHQPITLESKESGKTSRIKRGKILLNRRATLQMIGYQTDRKFSGQSTSVVQ